MVDEGISALKAQMAGMYSYQSGLTGAVSDLVNGVKKGEGDPVYVVNFLQGIIDSIIYDYLEIESW